MPDLIDAHLHLWDPDRYDYRWLASEPALNRRFGPEVLDPGGHDVVGVIVVEAGCADALAEVGWLEQLVADWPIVRGVVAQAPIELGTAVGPHLATLARSPILVGVRRNVQDEPAGFMTAPDFISGVRLLAGHGLPFDACVREHQLPELIRLVDECPDVTFVLDHLGKPGIRQRRREPWSADLRELGRRGNVSVKLSGLTTEADRERWRPSDIAPYLRHAIDTFGPHRCLFGSDWPVATLATSYQRWVELVLDAIADLSDEEQAAVLGQNAALIYLRNQ